MAVASHCDRNLIASNVLGNFGKLDSRPHRYNVRGLKPNSESRDQHWRALLSLNLQSSNIPANLANDHAGCDVFHRIDLRLSIVVIEHVSEPSEGFHWSGVFGRDQPVLRFVHPEIKDTVLVLHLSQLASTAWPPAPPPSGGPNPAHPG